MSKKLEEKTWRYWIPSAGRVDNIKTVDYLLKIGVPKENINIMVRDDEFEAYNNKYKGMVHILPEQKTKNIGIIRNGIVKLCNFEEHINCILDDDTTSFLIWTNDGTKYGNKTKVANIEDWQNRYIEVLNTLDLDLVPAIGQKAGGSNFIFQKCLTEEITYFGSLSGSCFVVLDPDFQFINQPFYEDKLTCFDYWIRGKVTPIINNLGMLRLPERTAKGGIDYKSIAKEIEEAVAWEAEKFPFAEKRIANEKYREYQPYELYTNKMRILKYLASIGINHQYIPEEYKQKSKSKSLFDLI